MSKAERLDTLNLHIYLGIKSGCDVTQLVEMRKQRYLPDCNIYLNESEFMRKT